MNVEPTTPLHGPFIRAEFHPNPSIRAGFHPNREAPTPRNSPFLRDRPIQEDNVLLYSYPTTNQLIAYITTLLRQNDELRQTLDFYTKNNKALSSHILAYEEKVKQLSTELVQARERAPSILSESLSTMSM